jgi:hypothetical protein
MSVTELKLATFSTPKYFVALQEMQFFGTLRCSYSQSVYIRKYHVRLSLVEMTSYGEDIAPTGLTSLFRRRFLWMV